MCRGSSTASFGCSADAIDEYVRIEEDTILEVVRRFTQAVIEDGGPEYSRAPSDEDMHRETPGLIKERGWVGVLGSIDCMHWTWRNCHAEWKGQYNGHSKKSSHHS